MIFDGRLVISVVAVGVAAIVIMLFATSNLSWDAVAINPRDAPEVEEPEVIEDVEAQAQAEAEILREVSAYQLASADPRIKELTKDVYNHNMDFTTTEDGDGVTVHVVKQRQVEGDYTSGYTITYTGKMDVKMIIADGKIVSREEIPLPDKVKQISYTEEEKKIIEAALADSRAIELGAADATYIGTDTDVRVFTEIECPNSECVTVMMEEGSGNGWIRVLVDSDDLSIVEVQWVPRE
ncbi:MAG: hypothetical protein ACREAZ_10965 [Nitrososphaera sp.]